jgi:hypothetical protein
MRSSTNVLSYSGLYDNYPYKDRWMFEIMIILDKITRNEIEEAGFISAFIDSDVAKKIAAALRFNTCIKSMNFSSATMNDASFGVIAEAISSRNIKVDTLILDFTKITRESNSTIMTLMDKGLLAHINMYWLQDYDEDEELRNTLTTFANEKKVSLSFNIFPVAPKMPTGAEINAFFKLYKEKENSHVNEEHKVLKPER